MKKIVIIDDDPGVQEACSLIFSKEQYEVYGYQNGNAVLNNECPVPDIYILDKQLSGIDGLDICRHLKSQVSTKDTPVIMISASPHLRKLAESAGADDTLEKPFSIKTLRTMVANYVSQ